MKTIVICLIVCCAGAFFACEQSIVNPPPVPPSGALTAANYMLSVKPGDSETFNQTVYDSTGRVINPTVIITMMVLDTNIWLANGEKAVKVAYTQRDFTQPYETDYITSSDSGIISYSDIGCKKFKNILLNPLKDSAWFGLYNTVHSPNYSTIDSLLTHITTTLGTFPALKVIECENNIESSNGHRDSIATTTEAYLSTGNLVVYQRATEIQWEDDNIKSETITVTDLKSKTWCQFNGSRLKSVS